MEHLHNQTKGTKTCLVNVLLFLPALSDEEMMEEESSQRAREQEARRSLESTLYADVLSGQCRGPLQRFVIPTGSKRGSRRPLFHEALIDRDMAREVDFTGVLEALENGSLEEAAECVPLDMEHRVCR